MLIAFAWMISFNDMIILAKTKPLCKGKAWLPFQKSILLTFKGKNKILLFLPRSWLCIFFFLRVALTGPGSVAISGLHPGSHWPLFAIAPTHEWIGKSAYQTCTWALRCLFKVTLPLQLLHHTWEVQYSLARQTPPFQNPTVQNKTAMAQFADNTDIRRRRKRLVNICNYLFV